MLAPAEDGMALLSSPGIHEACTGLMITPHCILPDPVGVPTRVHRLAELGTNLQANFRQLLSPCSRPHQHPLLCSLLCACSPPLLLRLPRCRQRGIALSVQLLVLTHSRTASATLYSQARTMLPMTAWHSRHSQLRTAQPCRASCKTAACSRCPLTTQLHRSSLQPQTTPLLPCSPSSCCRWHRRAWPPTTAGATLKGTAATRLTQSPAGVHQALGRWLPCQSPSPAWDAPGTRPGSHRLALPGHVWQVFGMFPSMCRPEASGILLAWCTGAWRIGRPAIMEASWKCWLGHTIVANSHRINLASQLRQKQPSMALMAFSCLYCCRQPAPEPVACPVQVERPLNPPEASYYANGSSLPFPRGEAHLFPFLKRY